jgi:hypothetical protein
MRYYEIGIVHLEVHGHGGQHHARQAAEHEDHDEADDEEHRRCQSHPPQPHRGNPTENLDAANM